MSVYRDNAKRKIEFVKKSAGAEKRNREIGSFFVCAPWARSNGCKSRTRPDSGKRVAGLWGKRYL